MLYVAAGDSLSFPSDLRNELGWTELIANQLGPRIAHINLTSAVATSEQVEVEQLPLAIALQPDVITLRCGANDVISVGRPSIDSFAERFERILTRLRTIPAEPVIVAVTYPDLAGVISARPRTKRRLRQGGEALNACIRELARAQDVAVVDWGGDGGDEHPAHRGGDALHAQRAVAISVLRLLASRGICASEGPDAQLGQS
jgi:lysophospholipase L1-like esterase